jgi:hypothetical protein
MDPPTIVPGGNPVTAVPGNSPTFPFTIVGPVLVTVELPSTVKLAAEFSVTGNWAACRQKLNANKSKSGRSRRPSEPILGCINIAINTDPPGFLN